MNTDDSQRLTPEEQELDKKRTELASLESQLTQQELELATLQAEMRIFEARYLHVVGRLYAELDELQAQIAEALACLHPENQADREHAAQARAQARESADAAGIAEVPKAQDSFHPSDDLKKLYRDVARCVHPDLATNEADRVRRHAFMADVNQAYAEEDVNRLRSILHEWESNPEAVEGDGIAAELVRIIRKIDQVQGRLNAIGSELEQLQASELFQLKRKVEEAESKGQDLLATMARRIQADIVQAREWLKELHQEILST